MANAAPIHLQNGAPMHGDQIDGVFRKERQQSLDGRFVIESEPRLHGELSGDGPAQGSQD